MPVRPGRPEDVEAVVALVAEVDRERGEALDEAALRTALAGAVLFVAEADGRVVGNLGLHRGEARSASLGMSVAADWRRRGLGAALLRAAVEWAETEGLERLTLEVLAGNVPALSLYRTLGFQERGRRPAERGEVVIMSRAIGRDP